MKSKNITQLTVDSETTLMPFLLEKLKNKNRDNIKSLLRNKQVVIDGRPVSQFNHPLKPGENIVIDSARRGDVPPAKYLRIVFEDDHIIIIDKKAGLLSVSDGHHHETAHRILTNWLRKKDPSAQLFIVHRLDQYTSGLLMFVKDRNIQHILRNEWKRYVAERVYTAIVEGIVTRDHGTIQSYLAENKSMAMISVKDASQGKLAVTHYKKIKQGTSYTLLEIRLDTGRKNQIRVHMHDIGHPVAGDRKYGAKTDPTGRLMLHATVLQIVHPVNGEIMRFESPVSKEFLRLIS